MIAYYLLLGALAVAFLGGIATAAYGLVWNDDDAAVALFLAGVAICCGAGGALAGVVYNSADSVTIVVKACPTAEATP